MTEFPTTWNHSRDRQLRAYIDGGDSDEQGVGKMMHAFVPNGYYWMLATEVIEGWEAPEFQTVDGIGSYTVAPFTGAPGALPAPPLNEWQQNTAGAAVHLNVMAAIVGSRGTNGHMYLLTSADGVTLIRQDFLALRTGAAGS